jgi:hypothetical protein
MHLRRHPNAPLADLMRASTSGWLDPSRCTRARCRSYEASTTNVSAQCVAFRCGMLSGTAKEAHRVRFVLDRTPESIGLLSPTAIGLLLGLGLWCPKNSGSPLDSGSWCPKQIGLLLELGLSGPKQIGLFLGLGLSGPKQIGLCLGLGLSGPRPVGLWFGLGLLVWSGLGLGGRVPPPLSRHWAWRGAKGL